MINTAPTAPTQKHSPHSRASPAAPKLTRLYERNAVTLKCKALLSDGSKDKNRIQKSKMPGHHVANLALAPWVLKKYNAGLCFVNITKFAHDTPPDLCNRIERRDSPFKQVGFFFLKKSWTNYMSTDFCNATWGRHQNGLKTFDSLQRWSETAGHCMKSGRTRRDN